MNAKQPSGSSLKEELMSVQRQGIVVPELEDEPELNEMFHEVWSWFLRLNNKRQSGFGVSPLTYSEIRAFFDLISYLPQAWELEIIELLDNLILEEYAEQQEKENKKNKK